MKRLERILQNKDNNHIFPFLWLHGEEEAVLREYMQKIYQSDIGAVCLEARPHPEFVQDGWWRDIDIILDEAKKLDMKLWLLDDVHFPTGYANGAIKERYPHLRKRFLKLHQLDFAGPQKYGRAIIKYAFSDQEDELIGVYLARKTGFEAIDATTLIDITENVRADQTVTFSLPAGEWKLLTVLSTWKGGEEQTEDYLNPLDSEATDILIKEVYEPHYKHYRQEFGKTILGFFSDEPRFGNMHGADGSIGRYSMVLPWRKDLAELLARQMNISAAEAKSLLPLLFIEGGATAHQVRYAYMDLVSELYAEHFSARIGSWCRSHGVQYIGHTIEDNNASARLGYGAGHFFRAMRGQDMAGIDVVLHQLLPEMDHGPNKSMTRNGWDGEFFHYVLAKLGASLAHIDPSKNGRIMCEVFGAYGWSEGNRLMKWITDFMLVRGVNEFVPHAFDPKEYPDVDCPPHFYAHGKNPQFEDFRLLMRYMNRLADLLSNGVHCAPVAVGYHGEAEWSGEYMLEQVPCAALTRNQIDFDILPAEEIIKADVTAGQMLVNKEKFRALVVPYAEALPEAYLKRLVQLAKEGVSVFIIQDLPVRSSDGTDVDEVLQQISAAVQVVTMEELVPMLWQQGLYEVRTKSYEPYLRYYHYEHQDMGILMLVNEAASAVIDTELELPDERIRYRYDAFENTVKKYPATNHLSVRLAAGESAVYVWPRGEQSEEQEFEQIADDGELVNTITLDSDFEVKFKTMNRDDQCETMNLERLVPIQEIEGKEDFAGVIHYKKEFAVNQMTARTILELDSVYEGARVSVNGQQEQIKICPPYQYDISDSVRAGQNDVEIAVTTTLGSRHKDWLSQFMLLEPMGITEQIRIKQYR